MKLDIAIYNHFGTRNQPPSGGCVLKHDENYIAGICK